MDNEPVDVGMTLDVLDVEASASLALVDDEEAVGEDWVAKDDDDGEGPPKMWNVALRKPPPSKSLLVPPVFTTRNM